jgi:hypothetical protein
LVPVAELVRACVIRANVATPALVASVGAIVPIVPIAIARILPP